MTIQYSAVSSNGTMSCISQYTEYLNTVLEFSGSISGHWPSMPCLLAAMPSKDAEIHGHQWPDINHSIFYDY